MIHLAIGGTSLVIINSVKIANDLFDKRSSIYSDRPPFPMIRDLMGWDWFMPALPYGEQWKEQRRLFQQHFHPSNVTVYEDIIVEYVHEFLSDMLQTPQDFLAHVRRTTGGVAISLAYGIKIKRHNDPFVKLAEDAIDAVAAAGVPGAFLVDVFPVLKYVPEFIPGAGFKQKAKEWRQDMLAFRNDSFAEARSRIELGNARPSFTSRSIEGINSPNVEHQMKVIQDTAGLIYGAASHTTISAIYTFLIAMLHYPYVIKKAQSELDRVVGQSRLPVFGDMERAPYVTAIVKEVLRWQPVAPQEEDMYEGYVFPAGTIFVPNAWAMLHNEEYYPDPMTFKPERFLDSKGEINVETRDPNGMAFGFGRRICAGAHIAEATLWLTIASVLSTLDILPRVDKDGNDILPKLFYQSSIVSYPLPFECDFKPRSREAEFLIRSVEI
ncbi:cytochrome P450 [Crucibulum laeve]|uniref:Cytochrome P450 n=1 Tax=Crucibulum laeve TaxID=68775 RepID=A0A5C3M903_9AGAR|nr:cytochrome P450 [Crucibulum laeve]